MLPKRVWFWSLTITLLSGCATPYGEKLSIDDRKAQSPGSITVSDAKLYRREALINERRREIRYIDELMALSEKEGFTIGPDLDREVEVRRSVALGGSLAVDPAAGRAYRDANESSSSTPAGGKSDDSGEDESSSDAAPAPLAADTSAISARTDGLQTDLGNRLGAEVKGPRAVSLQGNPSNQFRDRAAYRQMLTTARNAASLDELHDLDGASLYRMTFQVTTLPPEKSYLRTAGLVSMVPRPLMPDDDEMYEIYGRWLDHINQALGQAKANDPARLEVDSLLTANDLFGVIQLQYVDSSVKPNASKKKAHRALANPKAAKAAVDGCRPGLTSKEFPRGSCKVRMIVVPDLVASSLTFSGENQTMGSILDTEVRRLYERFDNDKAMLSNQQIVAKIVDSQECTLKPVDIRRTYYKDGQGQRGAPNPLRDSDALVSAAASVSTGIPLLVQAIRRVAASADSAEELAALASAQQRLLGAGERAREVLRRVEETACAGRSLQFKEKPIVVPRRFRDLVVNAAQVRVYEVGPREQVQQISTAARAAEALGLALSLAAASPGTGRTANAGLGFARSAIGKVDTIERLPLVVGFAQAGNGGQGEKAQPQFGWILGPRINTIDARKGVLGLEQVMTPYDLSVDLSIGGWRTKMEFDVRTAWSPNWRSGSSVGSLAAEANTQRTLVVNLRPTDAEFAELTSQLAAGMTGRGQRIALVQRISPDRVRACEESTLIMEGQNLWRASDVLLGTVRVGGDNISILKDMGGIMVHIPAKTSFASSSIRVQVPTPYGIAVGRDPLIIDAYDAKGCGKVDAAEGPAVSEVSPLKVNICSSPTFTLTGRDLDKLTRVQFGPSAKGSLVTATAKGTKRDVSFKRQDLSPIATEVETLEFFVGDKSIGSKAIRAVRLECGQVKE